MNESDVVKRYRVAIDLSCLEKTKTGTAVHIVNLLEAIRKLDPSDIDLLDIRGPRPLRRKNIFTKLLNALLDLCWLHIRLPYWAVREDIDLIHFPANVISSWGPSRRVVTIHDTSFLRFPELYDRLWRTYIELFARYAARHADKILTVSQTSAKDIAGFYGVDPAKIRVTGSGFQRKQTNNKANSSPVQDPYILYVGEQLPHKNLPRLIKGFTKALPDIQEGTKLVLVGPFGPDTATIRQAIQQHHLSEKVLLAGYVNRTVLEDYYAYAKLFAFPSLNEGFGVPPLEAMSYGLPVIASNKGAIPEIVGNAAILFDALDESDIADAIVKGLTDENLRSQLIENGYSQVKRFSWEAMAQRTLEAYREVLDIE